jgi:hypothetical protein
MRRSWFLVAISLCCVSRWAAGEVVEIPLPELTGQYINYELNRRTCSFELSKAPTVVHGASLRLVGTATVRMSWCGFGSMEPYPETIWLFATMPDTETGAAWGNAMGAAESGAFDVTLPFQTTSGATWAFLNDKTGQIEVDAIGCPIVDLCWPVTICSEAFVEQAVLVLDAEFPVPVDESTWGRIKALYQEQE